MQIILNGEPRQIDADATIDRLLDQLGFAGRRLAVEVNRRIIPRSQHASHRLQADDRVELVQAIGGG
jgi:sulfur carrier protein